MSITHRKVLSTSVSVMNWTVIVHTLEYLRRSTASSSHGTSVYFYSWSCVKALSYASPLVIVTACWNSWKACKKLRSLNFLCSHSSVSSVNDSAPMTHKYLQVMKMYSVVVINIGRDRKKKSIICTALQLQNHCLLWVLFVPQTNSSKAIKACIDEMGM